MLLDLLIQGSSIYILGGINIETQYFVSLRE